MVNAIVRMSASVILGLVIAFSFMSLSSTLALPTAQAARSGELQTDDFLDDGFRRRTGLGNANLEDTIGGIIRAALGFLGVIAVVIVLFGGFKWMVAGGNDEKVAEAKRLIIAGIIGLAIILSAYAITEFVIRSLLTASR